MKFVADLHLHSKYSRAVSPSMTLPVMAEYAKQKGLDILTASDWTHPAWFKETQTQLEETGEGIYKIKSQNLNLKTTSQISKLEKDILFLLSTEISSIYKQGDKLRRIHNLVFMPSFTSADKFNKELIKRGCNLNADGRPIIGLSSKNLLELILSIDARAMLIPCHVWTPHFGVYGSKSGFDSLEEAFGDLSKYVYGIETGISSDPEMNWRVKELEHLSILSFSDAHSPANMGREATVFVPNKDKNGISNFQFPISNEKEKISYEDIRRAIARDSGGRLKIGFTIEFYPEEGKYHYSGHRLCKTSLSPREIIEKGKICPVCSREFTEGVAIRIEQLAGAETAETYEELISESGVKWHTDKSKNHPPYVKLVRLEQIIGRAMGVGGKSKRVKAVYDKIVAELGSELKILLESPINEIEEISSARIAEGVARVRSGKIAVDPGYDGEYGAVKIFGSEEHDKPDILMTMNGQLGLDI